MHFLILSILSSTAILVIFKLFAKYKVDNLQAIVFNYLVAGIMGYVYQGDVSITEDVIGKEWSIVALLMGIMFIVVFFLMALATQKAGLAISSVANKMSVILPVIAAIILYGDSVSFLKVTGIILALAGIYLVSTKKGKLSFNPQYLWLPIVLFAASGFLDIVLNYAQQNYVQKVDNALFTSSIFLVAFICGLLFLTFQIAVRKTKFSFRNVIAGIALGIPNFGSIYFLLQALHLPDFDSSTLYPINNMGIVALSAISGHLFFKERLVNSNWFGILLAILAIAIMAYL